MPQSITSARPLAPYSVRRIKPWKSLTISGRISSPRNWQFTLLSEAEAARQEAASRQAAIDQHLSRSRALFRAGQYQDALTECDSALKADPSNATALALQKQIEQTRNILGK
jgi:Tfp pilus assembly protein PilF